MSFFDGLFRLIFGSRPASRKPSQRIEDLRAIPWSFSWGQCRLTLPGWYGFGTAVQEFLGGNPAQTRRERLYGLGHKEMQPSYADPASQNGD